MSEVLKGVVVTHAALGDSLVRATKEIAGEVDGLIAVSNEGSSAESLAQRVDAAIGGTPAVVFVDLPGGSCFQAAMRYVGRHPDVAVVAGVNLAMLIDFIYHRDGPAAQAATRAVEAGTRAIRVLPR